MRGDPSDGLPGVAGVGDKTAATLVSRFGDIDGLLAAVDDPTSDLAPTLRRKLADARDYLAVAPLVVAVRTDVPVPEIDTKLPSEPHDPEALVELGERWNLDSSLNRVLTALARFAAAKRSQEQQAITNALEKDAEVGVLMTRHRPSPPAARLASGARRTRAVGDMPGFENYDSVA